MKNARIQANVLFKSSTAYCIDSSYSFRRASVEKLRWSLALIYTIGLGSLLSLSGCTTSSSLNTPAAQKPTLNEVLIPGQTPTVVHVNSSGEYEVLPAAATIVRFSAPWPTSVIIDVDGDVLEKDIQAQDKGYMNYNIVDPSTPAKWEAVVSPAPSKRRGPRYTIHIRNHSDNPNYTGTDQTSDPLTIIATLPQHPLPQHPFIPFLIGGDGATTPSVIGTGSLRTNGSFVEINCSLQTDGQVERSPDGQYSVSVQIRKDSFGTPQGHTAIFNKGGMQIKSQDFNVDARLGVGGGAGLGGGGKPGFSIDSSLGVVLSAKPSGSSDDFLYAFVPLTSATPPIMNWPVNAYPYASASASNYSFQPRVFASPDCSLVVVVGANRLSNNNMQKYVLTVLDLKNNIKLLAPVVYFDNVPNSQNFGLNIVAAPNNQQNVEVTVDGHLKKISIP